MWDDPKTSLLCLERCVGSVTSVECGHESGNGLRWLEVAHRQIGQVARSFPRLPACRPVAWLRWLGEAVNLRGFHFSQKRCLALQPRCVTERASLEWHATQSLIAKLPRCCRQYLGSGSRPRSNPNVAFLPHRWRRHARGHGRCHLGSNAG